MSTPVYRPSARALRLIACNFNDKAKAACRIGGTMVGLLTANMVHAYGLSIVLFAIAGFYFGHYVLLTALGNVYLSNIEADYCPALKQDVIRRFHDMVKRGEATHPGMNLDEMAGRLCRQEKGQTDK